MEPLGPRERTRGVCRRWFLQASGLAGAAWMTRAATLLAQAAEKAPASKPPKSLVCLWLTGGPSQLETFDPHPGTAISYGTKGIETRLPGVLFGQGLERTADIADELTIVRSMVSREADHVRGSYLMKTGYSPDLSVMHPSIGAILCHELPAGAVDIPRHISILGAFFPRSDQPARGGFLGSQYDAFKIWDPDQPAPDLRPPVALDRHRRRFEDIAVVDRAFSVGRDAQARSTAHAEMIGRAWTMITSEQMKAFDISGEPERVRATYGNSPFGRGCLMARRLIEAGVRCVEVSLNDWDSHRNNHAEHRRLITDLDPALSGLIRDLRERGLLEETIVLCGGEFGRSPVMNKKDGRDHWTQGFSLVLAGGGFAKGRVIGETDPGGGPVKNDKIAFQDVFATVLTALGLDPSRENESPDGRPFKLSQGKVVRSLFA